MAFAVASSPNGILVIRVVKVASEMRNELADMVAGLDAYSPNTLADPFSRDLWPSISLAQSFNVCSATPNGQINSGLTDEELSKPSLQISSSFNVLLQISFDRE